MNRIYRRCLFLFALLFWAMQTLAQNPYQPGSAPVRNQGGNSANPYQSGGNMPPPSQQPITPADPATRAKVHTELAALYFQIGNMAVALEELRIALEADSNYAPAYSVRGLVHAQLREFPQAEEQFRKALDLTPNDPEVNNNYGWFLCQQPGKERQSITYFLNALKSPLYATPEIAYSNAGRCALKAGDMEGAEQYLSQAIRMSRDGGLMSRFLYASLHYKQGNLQLAKNEVAKVLKAVNQPTADVLWLALRIERKLGNRIEEGSLAAQLRSRYPDSPEYQDFLKGNFE